MSLQKMQLDMSAAMNCFPEDEPPLEILKDTPIIEKVKAPEQTQTQDISFLTNVKFDQNNRFLVGYGLKKIFMLNIEENKSKQYEINSGFYERIYDLNL